MNILILTQWFAPEPSFKGLPFAKELERRGHKVQILTGFPNYPEGKLYPGYKIRLIQRETIDGISVIRTALYPSHDSSAFRRVINYLSFAFSAGFLGLFAIKKVDIVYAYHAPATIAFPAILFKIIKGIPFLYDINDLWPDSLAASNMLRSKFILKCVDSWCAITYRLASHIVVPTPGCKLKLIERGVSASKIDVIYNWCDEAQKNSLNLNFPTFELGFGERFNIIFAGTMGEFQGLDAVIDAAKILEMQESRIRFVFIGGGVDVERLKNRIIDESIENCLFLPRRPVSEIGGILQLADALLVHLKDLPLFAFTIPSKTSAYIAVGKPIIMAVRGDAAELVQAARAGICCAPESPQDIARAALELFAMSECDRKQMGANGRDFYESELSIKVGVEKFERLFSASIS